MMLFAKILLWVKEREACLVHLLRADIVDGDDEDTLVTFQEPLEIVRVVCAIAM